MSGTEMLVYAFIKTPMLGINYELTDLLLTINQNMFIF